MNPTPRDIVAFLDAGGLPQLLRGELGVFVTPPEINDDMRPTDHSLLLEKGLYPLADFLSAPVLSELLEQALRAICTDARGVFCAVQCFHLEVLAEEAGRSPLRLDRVALVAALHQAFVAFSEELHALSFLPKDLSLDRRYKLTQSAFRVLQRDHGVAPPGIEAGDAYP